MLGPLDDISPMTRPNRPEPRPDETQPASPQPNSLELINMAVSADRKKIHVHFVTHGKQVLTVQLEIDLATRFCQGLSNVLGQISAPADENAPKWH
jgi:hypothetical protein